MPQPKNFNRKKQNLRRDKRKEAANKKKQAMEQGKVKIAVSNNHTISKKKARLLNKRGVLKTKGLLIPEDQMDMADDKPQKMET